MLNNFVPVHEPFNAPQVVPDEVAELGEADFRAIPKRAEEIIRTPQVGFRLFPA